MIDILDANDREVYHADFVPISEIVPGDVIEADDLPRFVVENITMVRVQASQHKVRRYLIEPVDGEPFQLPAKRKVKRF